MLMVQPYGTIATVTFYSFGEAFKNIHSFNIESFFIAKRFHYLPLRMKMLRSFLLYLWFYHHKHQILEFEFFLEAYVKVMLNV